MFFSPPSLLNRMGDPSKKSGGQLKKAFLNNTQRIEKLEEDYADLKTTVGGLQTQLNTMGTLQTHIQQQDTQITNLQTRIQQQDIRIQQLQG